MRYINRVADILGIGLGFFAFYHATLGAMEGYQYRSLFLGTCLIIGFLIKPCSQNRYLRTFDFMAAAICGLIAFYQYHYSFEILLRAGDPNTLDLVLSFLIIALLLEITRRTVGLPMVILALVFLFYQHELVSLNMPGLLKHGGSSLWNILDLQFTTFDGVFGIPLAVVSRTVVIFIVFAALLEWVGAGKLFMLLAQSLVGTARGGPAKIAVISSAFFGTLTGSAIANVVGTGSFTIPMMKKTGYTPEDSGAIEAAASSGGQIMPPIMGAAAFLISGFLEISYSAVMLIALIPALLYFVAVYAAVHFKAIKYGLTGLSKADMPSFWKTILSDGILLLPLISIIGLMVVGYTPEYAGVVSTCLLMLVAICSKRIRNNISLKTFLETMARGGKSMVSVTSACAAAGIIVAVVVDTGVGARTSGLLQSMAFGHSFLILFFAMIGSIILGMGVPTTAAYVVVAILIAPTLEGFGIPLIAAHYFAFYFAIKSGITPPVALAAYAAAPVADADPFKTGVKAFFIGLPSFIVPFLFCYNDSLLFMGNITTIIFYTTSVALAIIAFCGAIEGAFTIQKIDFKTRVFLFAVGSLMYYPLNYLVNVLGICLFGFMIFYTYYKKNKLSAKLSADLRSA